AAPPAASRTTTVHTPHPARPHRCASMLAGHSTHALTRGLTAPLGSPIVELEGVMKRALTVLGMVAFPLAAAADDVYLKGGGVLRGEVVQDGATSLVIEVGPGRITVPRSR